MKAKKINWISEYDEELEMEIYYIVDEQNNRFNLSNALDCKINDIYEIVNDDLIYVNVDNYFDVELTGIYSFKQDKLIFPFIIEDIGTPDENGFIYLRLNDEDTTEYADLGLNENNNFAYITKDGSVFQNEGIIEEKINDSHYILKPTEYSNLYMLYSTNYSDDYSDSNIIINNIESYYHYEKENLLIFETEEAVGIYDISKNEILLNDVNLRIRNIDIKNSNFFLYEIGKYKKIINRKGQVLFGYSDATRETQKNTIETNSEEKGIEYHELNLGNEFYEFETSQIAFNKDYITICATNVFMNKNIVIIIDETGENKIIDIDLKWLNMLVEDLLHKHQYYQEEVSRTRFLKELVKKGVKFELFKAFESLDYNQLPFKEKDKKLISSVIEDMGVAKVDDKYRLADMTEKILMDINKFDDDSYFKISKEGIVLHLLLHNQYWFREE
jgi:hypothetical protein